MCGLVSTSLLLCNLTGYFNRITNYLNIVTNYLYIMSKYVFLFTLGSNGLNVSEAQNY